MKIDYKEFIKSKQQKIVLATGYLLVAALAFGLGRISVTKYSIPEIKVEEAFQAPSNYTPTVAGIQSANLTCTGKIKGSSSMIFHLPGGSFYNRTTNPTRCFDSEAEAKAAGFRKSSR